MRRLAKILIITAAVLAPAAAASVVAAIGRTAAGFLSDKAPEVEAHLPVLSRWALVHAPSIRLAMVAQALLVLLMALIVLRRAKTEENLLASLLLLTTGSLVLVIMAFALCLLAWYLPFASGAAANAG